MAVLGGFCAISLWAMRPLVAGLGERIFVGPDPLHHLWIQNWLARHVTSPAQLLDGNVFHPHPSSVLYSDLSLGTTIFLVPIAPFVDNPILLFNLGILIALTLGAWGFYALTLSLTGNRSGAICTGILAAYGSHQLSHIYHLNLLTIGWLPIFLLALHKLLEGRGWHWSLLAGTSYALLLQSSGYYAVAGALLALIFAAWHGRALFEPKIVATVALSVVAAGLLAGPYIKAFLELRSSEGLTRAPGLSRKWSFQPGRDITSRSYVHRRWLGNEGERLFPGVAAPALALLALVRRHRRAGLYAVATASLLILSLGPELRVGEYRMTMPYTWLFAMPPFDGMRHPYTFAAVATFLLCVMAGMGWSTLGVARHGWAKAAIVTLAVVETIGPPPQDRLAPVGLPPAYESLLRHHPSGPILEIPFTAPDQMLWAARLPEQRWVNGDAAFRPRSASLLDRFIERHWVRRPPGDVDDSKVTELLRELFRPRWIIVPAGRRPVLWRLAVAMDESSSYSFVLEATDGDRVYEFHPDGRP